MDDLKITLIQSDLYWENKEKNLELFSKKIAAINENTDLIVLPEMFTTGFSMRPEKFAEPMTGTTVNWMKRKAQEKNSAITGSFMCEENGNYYNRLVWMNVDGTFSTYDKRHLFRVGEEDKHYHVGGKKIIVDLKGWKICPLICYDLRFPVWSRNTRMVPTSRNQEPKQKAEMNAAYDILMFVANWPEKRAHHWKSLLTARAIENQTYVIGVNRIGNDGNGLYHSGDSMVFNAKGEVISKTKPHADAAETITLNYRELDEFRKGFPTLVDADAFDIILSP